MVTNQIFQRLYYFDFNSSPEHLKTHVRRIHEGIKNHKCAQCDKAFFQYGELKKHVKDIHDGIREFKCEQCGKAFRDDWHYDTKNFTFQRFYEIFVIKCYIFKQNFSWNFQYLKVICINFLDVIIGPSHLLLSKSYNFWNFTEIIVKFIIYLLLRPDKFRIIPEIYQIGTKAD